MNAKVFETLSTLNVNEHTEIRKDNSGNELTYLSWPWAVQMMTKSYPDWSYEVVRNAQGLPYVYDPLTGYMVTTRVTAGGETKEMWLPVMDGNNRAMKAESYVVHTKYREITVQPATMFDVNKSIMRCLVKNLAMFGLGLYIYAGEDLPDAEQSEETVAPVSEAVPAKKAAKKTATPVKNETQGEIPFMSEDKISMEERKAMFTVAGNVLGDARDATIKEWFAEMGIISSANMTREQYNAIIAKLREISEKTA